MDKWKHFAKEAIAALWAWLERPHNRAHIIGLAFLISGLFAEKGAGAGLLGLFFIAVGLVCEAVSERKVVIRLAARGDA